MRAAFEAKLLAFAAALEEVDKSLALQNARNSSASDPDQNSKSRNQTRECFEEMLSGTLKTVCGLPFDEEKFIASLHCARRGDGDRQVHRCGEFRSVDFCHVPIKIRVGSFLHLCRFSRSLQTTNNALPSRILLEMEPRQNVPSITTMAAMSCKITTSPLPFAMPLYTLCLILVIVHSIKTLKALVVRWWARAKLLEKGEQLSEDPHPTENIYQGVEKPRASVYMLYIYVCVGEGEEPHILMHF